MSNNETEYLVECLNCRGWYFCSRVHGLQRAIEWAAAFRVVKDEPSRVRPVK